MGRCYIKLYDCPPKVAAEEEEAAVAGLPAAERKKMRQKMRKAEARAKKRIGQKRRKLPLSWQVKEGKRVLKHHDLLIQIPMEISS
jgi:hypothetical protein